MSANEKKAAKLRKLEAQRGIAAFAFTGFIVGTLVAYQMTGALFPATAIGIAVGACSAFFITGIKVWKLVSLDRNQSTSSSVFIGSLKILLSRLGKVTISGAEHLSGPEGKIVVCNHVGWADPLWVVYSALPHTLHQMAKKELFDNPVLAWCIRAGGGFPIDRSRPSTATIKQVITLVEQGKRVLIFPQGTRSRDQTEAKRGAATIALHAKGQIVPTHYEGPEKIRFIHLFCRPLIRVTFGTPIVIPKDALTDKEVALRLTAELDEAMNAIAG
ncbi:MAG: 1-acyl-sn-glycerol-3-phosphate acyltransferase [Methylococcaceae bacterium]|nr:1-acyl-sn-glycerol-3-phosphate acyltransferase [Methylococcaceae bacterium]